MPRSPLSRRPSFLLLLSPFFLLGADCLGVPFDDDDAEPLLMATDGGFLARYAGGAESAQTVWTGSIDQSNRVVLTTDGSTAFVGAGTTISAFTNGGSGTNEAVWEWSAPDDVVALAGPASGRLVVMTTSTLHALSSSDGGELWTVDLLVDLSGVSDDAVALVGGDLLLGGDPTRRLDPATGDVTHTLATGSSDVSDLLIDSGVAYLATASGVVAAGASDLISQWTLPTSVPVDVLALGEGGLAYAERGGSVGVVTSTGNPVFDSGTSDLFDGLFVMENLVVAARADGPLFAWDELSGEAVWEALDLGGPVGALGANTLTAFYGHGDVLEGINLSDGSTLWQLSTTGSPAAVLPL